MKFTEPVMRPPQESRSLILRATQGCTYNDCHFCYVSRGYPFMAASSAELEAEAAANAGHCHPETPVYLAGANPFALPAKKLKEYIAAIRRPLPNFSRVSMQSRIDDIARKSDAELRELGELGLNHLYIGAENGNEAVLRLMNKGHTAEDTVEQLKRLDAASIGYTLFYVLGLGGKGLGIASGKATAAMFNRVRPTRITTTGMTIFPNTPVAEMARRGEFTEASEREKIEELRVFLQNLEVDTFYDGIHYLNPLNYRFATWDKAARQKVLADIDETLSSMSDADLEMMVSREKMLSL